MNYFTKEWVSGTLPDEEWEKAHVLYLEYIESILPRLSSSVAKLAKEINLHDGLIRKCIIDRQAAKLNLILRCGNLQSGYSDISLHYSNVEFSMEELTTLAELTRSRQVELLYDEVDLNESSYFVHRLLFSSLDEISITFAQLEIKKENQPNRSLSFEGDPFITAPGTHPDGTFCLENTKSVPSSFIPCCETFSGHTITCAYDVRYEWLPNSNEWIIVIPESAGGGGITMSFCPHCGMKL